MLDTSGIHQLVRQARRRLRAQAALELATLALIPASVISLAAVFAVRNLWITPLTGALVIGGSLALVAAFALAGALRRFPTHLVATRIDRASGLSDRLATACAFEEQLARGEAADPETLDLMRLAIADGARAVPRANAKMATPFSRPAELGPALAFVTVASLIAVLVTVPTFELATSAGATISDEIARHEKGPDEADKVALDDQDLAYIQDLLAELERTARETGDPHLQEFAKKVDELLTQAQLGEISKQKMLEKLAEAEKKYSEGADKDVEASMKELEKTGNELKKEKLTRELGKALSQGDLDKAREEMEKLAKKLENEELSQKQREKVADALEKAAEKFAQREKNEQKQRDEQIKAARQKIDELKQKLARAKTEREKSQLSRQLERKKRELKKLSRKKEEQQKSSSRRQLKELHRNMKQASKDMRSKSRQTRRQAARRMRDMRQNTGKVSADKRRMTNQRKIASQMRDLKDALRRAKRRGSRGPKDRFGRNKRNSDFQRRARGGQGNRDSWKPGQNGPGKNGQNGKNGKNGGKQPGQGGKKPGDGHDPDLLGDATDKSGDTKDQSLQGVHGKGPSTRETILSAAEKGFASQSYKKVYTRYTNQVEEIIRAEKVPAGYKYYIKKYFKMIKPQQ